MDSVEQIELTATGAQAVQGSYQVQWAGNINTPGAVQVTSPSGQLFSSTVYGLSYRDASTGSNVLIAPLQDSFGEIEGQNRAIYTNAFSGVNADIEYIYKVEGLEQNIVLREQPPSPADFNLNPETSFLDVVTKFSKAPAATTTSVTSPGVIDDQVIRFPDMLMGQGGAFVIEGTEQQQGCKVIKHWMPQEDGTVLLFEEISYSDLTNLAGALPLHSSNAKVNKKVRRTASVNSPEQKPSAKLQSGQGMKIAREEGNKKHGFVIDYTLGNVTNTAAGNFVFQGDTTYYISGKWYFAGSGVILFEGGAVIKYATNATIFDYGTNSGVFEGTTYRPTVFTAWNDNSVGTPLSSTNGPLTWVNLATCYVEEEGTSTNVVNNARFSYNDCAYTDYSHHYFVFRDCQFVGCELAIGTESAYEVGAKNVLFAGCSNVFGGYSTERIDGENVTADGCVEFAMTNSWWGPCTYSGGLTNCIVTGCGSTSFFTNNQDTVIANSSSGIYQTVGAGSYYLAANSPYVNAGTANIDPVLLDDLQAKTTYPPLQFAEGWFETNYTCFPQAQRDTDTPDLGYHYDPIDYATFIAISNVALTVLPGTVLGTYGPNYGVWVYTNGTLNCNGTATSPNYIVRYNTVQEQSNTNWEAGLWSGSVLAPPAVDSSSINITFTQWSALASDLQFGSSGVVCPVTLQNCQAYGGQFVCDGPNMASTNCLYWRVEYSLTAPSELASFYNNLFWNGSLTYRYNTNLDAWTFRDNLFDQSDITNLNGNRVAVCSNNAYVTTNYGVIIPENNDQILTASPAFETGDLGDYYYPASLTNLIHTGSQLAADAGLYWYTVTTNNAIEGTNIVSIGFHYVACGTNGLPLTTNGFEVPLYLMDANGNGVVDSGEVNWQVPGDLGLSVVITQPVNNSQIP